MAILLTGAAGFIGMHAAQRLLARGEQVIGIDSLNTYYDPALKRARLARLDGTVGFHFELCDFSDRQALASVLQRHGDIDRVVHFGAQAGVRHSITRPFDYLAANLAGQLVILEACRSLMAEPGGLRNFVYASSSSVYGANRQMPFSAAQRTDHPVSFYGATKKSGEIMAQAYAHLYGIPSVGLRFFTVYGPWGRPDMSAYVFTRKIISGETIEVFNSGAMKRDFTYIDDVIDGVVAALDTTPPVDATGVRHRIYNLGNSLPVALMDYIRVIERACGRKAVIELQPMQSGEVVETFADITESTRDLGYRPTTPIEVGIPRFVAWYRNYHDGRAALAR